MNKLIIVCLLTCCSCTTFGANQMFSDSDRGFVMLAGDAEGIRAYNDGLNGLITNTKASPDIRSSYWQNRDEEVSVRKMNSEYFSSHHPRFSAKREVEQRKQQNNY